MKSHIFIKSHVFSGKEFCIVFSSKIVEKKIVEVEAKSKDFSALEKKIDSAIKEIGYKKDYLEEKYVEDMGKVEELILPILYNLMKNPEKDYIYWPKRESIIMKQIEKIKDVTQDLSK